jgi:hypothetical protein
LKGLEGRIGEKRIVKRRIEHKMNERKSILGREVEDGLYGMGIEEENRRRV